MVVYFSHGQMIVRSMAILSWERNMVKAFIPGVVENGCIQDNMKMVTNKEWVVLLNKKEVWIPTMAHRLNTVVNSKQEDAMDMVSSFGAIKPTMVNGKPMWFTEKESSFGMAVVQAILATFELDDTMEREVISIQQVESMLVVGTRAGKVAQVYNIGQTVPSTGVNICVERDMGSVIWSTPMGARIEADGRKVVAADLVSIYHRQVASFIVDYGRIISLSIYPHFP